MKSNNEDRPNKQGAAEIDKIIHEPSRLSIMANLYVIESADFIFLLNQTGLTRGNLSVHLTKLEGAGYVKINKGYSGRRPQTILSLTRKGRDALASYKQIMERVLLDLPLSKTEDD